MENDSKFDFFELMVAILLGIAAIGASWAGYQGELWGGNMATAYGEAATMSTKAANLQTDAVVKISNDYRIDMSAKTEVSKAHYADSEAEIERAIENADYLYRSQMSFEAYKTLGLPVNKHKSQIPENKNYDDLALTKKELFTIAWEHDLDDDDNGFDEEMLEPSRKLFKQADDTFAKGKEYNDIGDKFSLVGVILTIALFFAGLALVFKSSVKWTFLGMGTLIFLGGTIYLITLPML